MERDCFSVSIRDSHHGFHTGRETLEKTVQIFVPAGETDHEWQEYDNGSLTDAYEDYTGD